MNKQPIPYNRTLFMKPGESKFENRAVLNPCLIEAGENLYHMLYRAVAPDLVSSVGYAEVRYGENRPTWQNRANEPLVAPQENFEIQGVEDPRIVLFEGEYHLFYTAWDGNHARLAHAFGASVHELAGKHLIGPLFTNRDAISIISDNPHLDIYRRRWGEDSPDQFLWEKDATILPRKVNGKIVMIHRLRPDIQIAFLDDLSQLDDHDFWEDYLRHMDEFRLMQLGGSWEESHIGMGPVPIETPEGWLMIYHGVTHTPGLTYRAGAALLDLDNPQKVIGRTKDPLFAPSESWEFVGDVNNVVFPEGLIVRGNELDIYYGGADTVIGVITVRLDELLDYLKGDQHS